MLWKNAKKKTKSLLFSRLQNPYECPFNGSRRQDCACRNDYLAAGFTVFSKIRFDVVSMQIKSKHFGSFSQCEHSLEITLVVIPKLSFDLIIDPIMPFLDKQFLFPLGIKWEFQRKKKKKPPLLPLLVCPKWSSGVNLADLYFTCELASVSKVLFP